MRSPKKAYTGITVLDRLLQGGLLSGTSTLVLGSFGTGKTVLGMQFLLYGARKKEKGLY